MRDEGNLAANKRDKGEKGVFYELRRYKVFEGKMDEWVEFMESEIIPFQIGKGMVITGSFRGEDDITYIWMRRFDSEDERKRLYAEVYDSEEWKNHFSPRVGQLIDREAIEVTRIIPTPRSATH